jgi:hypothetical protein
MPRVLRSGQLVVVPRGRYRGIWRIFSAKANLKVDLGWPDAVRMKSKGLDVRGNVLLSTLLRDGMKIADKRLTGVSECLSTSSA